MTKTCIVASCMKSYTSYFDPIIMLIIILSNIAIITIGIIKNKKKNKNNKFAFAQKVLRLFLGTITIIYGIYNIYLYVAKIEYKIVNRILEASGRIVSGISMLVLTFITVNQ